MRFLQFAIGLATVLMIKNVFAYGTGYSTYPWEASKKVISTEATGMMAREGEKEGAGGLQASFTYKANEKVTFDAGGGIQTGDRSGSLFTGVDYELFPDYMKQPRFSVRSSLETTKENEQRVNVLGVAPILAKGVSMWNKETYPFISLPMGLALNTQTSSYTTRVNLAAGIVGNVPINGYEKLTAKLEGQLNLKDSHNGVLFGVSYPFN